MRRSYILSMCFIWLLTAALFFTGILGTYFTVRRYIVISELEDSGITATATITRIDRGARGRQITYFTVGSSGEVYRTHIRLRDIRGGDEIEVKFNKEQTLFFISNTQSETFSHYAFLVFLFVVLFITSIVFFVILLKPDKHG